MILTIDDRKPTIDPSTFVAPNASIIGDVTIGADCGIWFGAVIRADSNTIRIGNRTNIQDLCVLHVDDDNSLAIGDDVTVGHRAILHGCFISDRVLIGMGATIMNGANVGEDSIIGAGALITEGTEIPPRSLVIGFPAKVKRELTEEEIESIADSSKLYIDNSRMYSQSSG